MQNYSVKVVFASDYEQLSAALGVLREISKTLQQIASFSQTIEKTYGSIGAIAKAASSVSRSIKSASRVAGEMRDIESAARGARQAVSSLASEVSKMGKGGVISTEELRARLGEKFADVEQEAVRRLVSRGMMESITESHIAEEAKKVAEEWGILSDEVENATQSIQGAQEAVSSVASAVSSVSESAKDVAQTAEEMKNLGDVATGAKDAVSSLASEVGKVSASGGRSLDDLRAKLGDRFEEVQKEAIRRLNMHGMLDTLTEEDFARAVEDIAKEWGILQDEVKKASDSVEGFSENISVSIAQTKEIEREMARLGRTASAVSMAGYLLSDAMNTVARYMAAFGGITLAPLVKSAYDFAKEFSAINEVSRAWNENTERIHSAYVRIGEVAARTFLPAIRLIADLSEKIAGFAERNPAAVAAVAAMGGLALSIATLLKLVAGGIRIAFDMVYVKTVAMWIESQLLAAKAIESASGKMLMAATAVSSSSAKEVAAKTTDILLGSGGLFGGIFKIGGTMWSTLTKAITAIGLFAGKVAIIVGLMEIYAELTRRVVNLGMSLVNPAWKEQTWKDIGTTARQAGAITIFSFEKVLFGREAKEAWEHAKRLMGLAVQETAEKTYTLSEAIKNLGIDMDSLLRDFEKMREAEKNILAKMNQDILKENENANRKIEEENRRHVDEIAKINQQSAEAIQRIRNDFNSDIARMAYEYSAERARIIEESNRQIEEAEREHQNRLYELKQEHLRRVAEIEDERDALALVRENQRYQDEVDQENRRFSEIIDRERRETALRLQELEARYAQERALRIAEYQRQIAEENAQKQQRIAEEQQRHNQELQEIARQREERIAEIRRNAQLEIQQLRQEFVDRLRMEIEARQAEKGLRQQYYSSMLADLETFLRQYRISLNSLLSGNVPTHDYTGYAYPGLYRFNQREFVLDSKTTLAMERIVGGRLTGERIIAGLRGGATFYFHFSNVTATDREIIARQAMEATLNALARVM